MIDQMDLSRANVMGILNVTPDSFSDGGRYDDVDAAVARAEQLVAEGADMLDIGAESTRPGFQPLDWATEWERLEPVLRALLPRFPIPISVDTYHPETAERVLAMGTAMINDISACADARMMEVMRGYPDAWYVFMHNRATVDERLSVADIVAECQARVAYLHTAGLAVNRLWIDPGIGFAKTHAQNLACIRAIDQFCGLGYPVLLGTSRKRVIGHELDLPVDERLEGSLATVAYGVLQGAAIVRVHDVKETVRLCRMLEAIRHAPIEPCTP